MGNRILFQFGFLSIEAALNDSPTAKAIWESLPIESMVNLWGNEIYFETPVVASLEQSATTDIAKGYVCYWPRGRAICIFFGPTPVPVHALAAMELEDVTKGYVPWSTSRWVP